MIKTAATQALEESLRRNERSLDRLRIEVQDLANQWASLMRDIDVLNLRNQEFKAALRRLEDDEE